jgi:hypothetical protein
MGLILGTDLEKVLVDLGVVKEGDVRLKSKRSDSSDAGRAGDDPGDDDDDWD